MAFDIFAPRPEREVDLSWIIRSDPRNARLVYLLVEGDTDRRLFMGFVDPHSCCVRASGGWESLMEILDALKDDPLVIAILDADFRYLDGTPAPDKCYLTDFHDIEMMMFASPALEKVLREHGSDEKLAKIGDVHELVLNAVADLACFRWFNEKQQYSYTFEGIEFKKFIDKKTLSSNIKSLIRAIKGATNANNQKPTTKIKFNIDTASDTQIETEILAIRKQKQDPYQLCNGHDVCAALNLAFTQIIGTMGGTEADTETALRLAYEYEFFRQSRLHADIAAWAATKNVVVWRAAA